MVRYLHICGVIIPNTDTTQYFVRTYFEAPWRIPENKFTIQKPDGLTNFVWEINEIQRTCNMLDILWLNHSCHYCLFFRWGRKHVLANVFSPKGWQNNLPEGWNFKCLDFIDCAMVLSFPHTKSMQVCLHTEAHFKFISCAYMLSGAPQHTWNPSFPGGVNFVQSKM